MTQTLKYPVIFAEVVGGNIIARVPDFVREGFAVPVHTKTIDDAMREVGEIIVSYFDEIEDRGGEFPKPSTLLEALDGFKSSMDEAGHEVTYVQADYIKLEKQGE